MKCHQQSQRKHLFLQSCCAPLLAPGKKGTYLIVILDLCHASWCWAFDSFQSQSHMNDELEVWISLSAQVKILARGWPGARLQADHLLAKAPWFDPFETHLTHLTILLPERWKVKGLRLHLWSPGRCQVRRSIPWSALVLRSLEHQLRPGHVMFANGCFFGDVNLW